MINSRSNFNDVFGDYSNAYTEVERKERWEQWKRANSQSQVKLWTNTQACSSCIHLRNDWCNHIGLPCAVNPVFGFKMTGMACQGVGIEERQKELFAEDLF